MTLKNTIFYKVLDSQATTGTNNKSILVGDFRHCVLTIATANLADATIKIYGSNEEIAPDFTAIASANNIYDTVQSIDLQNGASIDGDIGVIYTGTDGVRNLEMNINALNWIAIDVTAYAAGNITAKLQLSNNE